MTHWVSFVRGNPITFIDPSGSVPCKYLPSYDQINCANEKEIVSFTPAVDPLVLGAGGIPRGKNQSQYDVEPGNNGLCGLVSLSAILRVTDPDVTAKAVVSDFREKWCVGCDPNDLYFSELIRLINGFSKHWGARYYSGPNDHISLARNYRSWLNAGGLILGSIQIDSNGEMIHSVEAQNRYDAINLWLNDSRSEKEKGLQPKTPCDAGIAICHWVVVTGISVNWDYSNLDSSKNWLRIYNPFDNETEYHKWGDYYRSKAYISGVAVRVYRKEQSIYYDYHCGGDRRR